LEIFDLLRECLVSGWAVGWVRVELPGAYCRQMKSDEAVSLTMQKSVN